MPAPGGSNPEPNSLPSVLKTYPPTQLYQSKLHTSWKTLPALLKIARWVFFFYHFQVHLRERRILTDLNALCNPNPRVIPVYFIEMLL